jgi:hypothetical protein
MLELRSAAYESGTSTVGQSPRRHGYNGHSVQQTKWTSAAAKAKTVAVTRRIRDRILVGHAALSQERANDEGRVVGLSIDSRHFLHSTQMEKNGLMKPLGFIVPFCRAPKAQLEERWKGAVGEEQDRLRKRQD